MAYKGTVVQVPFGDGGLHTDDPQNRIPPTDLIRAFNIDLVHGVMEKEAGCIYFNQTPLPSGVIALYDWWPDAITQRLVCVTRDGNVWKYINGFIAPIPIPPSDTSPAQLIANQQTMMVAGGNEVTGNPRKLFIFSQSEPQVLTGDGTTRHGLQLPALDWTKNNQPYAGIIHRNSLYAWGNANHPHLVYASSATNHEDFQTIDAAFQYPCYSGEGERIVAGINYKGALFILKYPYGLYQLIDTDPSQINWYFTKIDGSLGAASPHSICTIINDVLIGNADGNISSATAVLAFGNLKAGEILYTLRNENFLRENMLPDGRTSRQCIYYSDKKKFMATYQSAGGIKNDSILYIDMMNLVTPKVYWGLQKDQPNCLALQKDYLGVPRPIYGADSGYIYQMDRNDRSVAGSAYTMDFQTPYLDFGFASPQSVATFTNISDINKNLDFLEVDYEPAGDWDLTLDLYIDGVLKKTVLLNLAGEADLDTFVLDEFTLDAGTIKQHRFPLNLTGRRLSIRGLQAGAGQNCRIARFNVYFRLGGQQQRGVE
jgi:hypothetical protein